MQGHFPFTKSSTRLLTLTVMILALFIIWIDRVVVLSYLQPLLTYFSYQVVVQITKLLGWLLPVYIFIHFFEAESFPDSLGLRANKRNGALWGVMAGMVLALIVVAVTISVGKSALVEPSLWSIVSLVFVAPVTEEIVMRGFLLTRFSILYGFTVANFATSFLFVLMHFPLWWHINYQPVTFDLVSLFVLGLFLGVITKRGNSLWAAITAHGFYNLMLLVLAILFR
ncbi:CPBP family intramembrane metalloprotease [candidate division WWE3 bacterium]|nr:CPBP family intramembrane metalloprotease [candidate division WWE3 bacterium]